MGAKRLRKLFVQPLGTQGVERWVKVLGWFWVIPSETLESPIAVGGTRLAEPRYFGFAKIGKGLPLWSVAPPKVLY